MHVLKTTHKLTAYKVPNYVSIHRSVQADLKIVQCDIDTLRNVGLIESINTYQLFLHFHSSFSLNGSKHNLTRPTKISSRSATTTPLLSRGLSSLFKANQEFQLEFTGDKANVEVDVQVSVHTHTLLTSLPMHVDIKID